MMASTYLIQRKHEDPDGDLPMGSIAWIDLGTAEANGGGDAIRTFARENKLDPMTCRATALRYLVEGEAEVEYDPRVRFKETGLSGIPGYEVELEKARAEAHPDPS